jgi:hypothetical protein
MQIQIDGFLLTERGLNMATDYRTTAVGTPGVDISKLEPKAAIEKMENELREMAASLRSTRYDYVEGMITEGELQQVELQFMDMLEEQRNILQLLRSAAKGK